MTQLDKNYNEYTCISSALEQVWLLKKMARKVGTVISLEKRHFIYIMAKLPRKMLSFGTHGDAMFYLPFVSKVTTSNPFTSTVRSCKGPTAYDCFDVFSPDSRLGTVWKSEHCEEVRFCSLLTTSRGAVSAMVLKSQEDSSPWFVSLSLRHQGKQRLGNSI